MKYRIIAALAAAVAVAALGVAAAHAAATPAQNFLGGGPCMKREVTFVSGGWFEDVKNGVESPGTHCRAANISTAVAFCVDGTTFQYALVDTNDPSASDLVSYLLTHFETVASVGAC